MDSIDIRRTWPIPGYRKTDAGFSPFRFIADFFLFFLSLKTCWKEKPSLLHCHLHEGALIGWLVKRCLFWRKIHVIMDMQGSLSGELEAYGNFKKFPLLLNFFKHAEKIICHLPDSFFCSSLASQQCLESDFHVEKSKITLLQDVVPDIFFKIEQFSIEKRADLGIPLDKHILLYTGSMLPGKGVQHLVEAMKRLVSQRNDLFFLLVGYPIDRIRKELEKEDLDGTYLLTGKVSYDALPSYLSAADIAIDPKEFSSGEASGKLLHYMAAGLPIVCFNTKNNRLILGNSGYFADMNSPSSLAKTIHSALKELRHDAIERGNNGRKRAFKRYSINSVGEVMWRTYDIHS